MEFAKYSHSTFIVLFSFVLLLVIIPKSETVSTRIYFARCDFAGFSCVTNNGKYHIVYQCPANEKVRPTIITAFNIINLQFENFNNQKLKRKIRKNEIFLVTI